MTDEEQVKPPEEFDPGQYTTDELSKIREHLEGAWTDMATKLNQMSAHALDTREDTIVKYMLEQHRVIARLVDYIAFGLTPVDIGAMSSHIKVNLESALDKLEQEGVLTGGVAPELGADFDEDALKRNMTEGPEFSDGHDSEGFPGGCERFGCPGGDECTEKPAFVDGPVKPEDINAHCLTILRQNVNCFPDWVTHIAMDATGVWFGYRNEPVKDIEGNKWLVNASTMSLTSDDPDYAILIVNDPNELPVIPLEDAEQYWEDTLVQVRGYDD